MTATEKEKLIDRVKRLLALGDQGRNNSVHEAALAAAMAQRLMQEHQLSRVDLEADEPEDELITLNVLGSEKQPTTWKKTLCYVLATNNGCTSVYTPSRRGFLPGQPSIPGKITLLGPRSAVDAVAYLYAALCREIDRLCVEQADRLFSRGAYGKRAWSNSFRVGAVNEIGTRLQAQRRSWKVGLDAKSTALVRRDEADLEGFVEKVFGKTRSGGRTHIRDGSGYYAGKRAGASIHLGSGGRGKLSRPAARLKQ